MISEIQQNAPGDISIYLGGDDDLNSKNHIFIKTTDTFTGSITGSLSSVFGNMLPQSTTVNRGQYTPEFCWFPRYRSADGGRFKVVGGQVFKGVTGIDGNQAGVSYTARQVRPLSWPWNEAENTVMNANGTSDDEAKRTFEYVLNHSRSRTVQYDTTGNKNPKGLFYIDDVTIFHGDGADVQSAEWDSGTPNKDNEIWCTTSIPDVGGNSRQDSDTFVGVSAALTSATVPAWDSF
jgi:hypothetical protein